jgi:cellulose biosynthesis protein BcsQ
MKRVAIANLKGGVGKSTTTVLLAETLALFHRQRVLVIDLDPQSNTSYMLLSRAGVEIAERQQKTLMHFLTHCGQRRARQYRELRPTQGERSLATCAGPCARLRRPDSVHTPDVVRRK